MNPFRVDVILLDTTRGEGVVNLKNFPYLLLGEPNRMLKEFGDR